MAQFGTLSKTRITRQQICFQFFSSLTCGPFLGNFADCCHAEKSGWASHGSKAGVKVILWGRRDGEVPGCC